MLPTMRFQLCKITTCLPTQWPATRVRHLHAVSKCWSRHMSQWPPEGTLVTLRLRSMRHCQVNVCKVMSRRGLASPSNEGPEKTTATQKLQQKAANAKLMINNIKDKAIPTHENIYTVPNFLTFARLVSAPFIGYLIMKHDYDFALGIFALAGFTDLLDGYIARKYNLKTVVGSIIDPLADKALMTVMTVTLAAEGVLPMPLAALILGRDAGLVLSSFYYRYISLPKPKTLVRYFDFSIPSAEVRPTMISKVNTALQLVLMAASLTSTALGQPSAEIMTALHWTVGGTTVWSGASYIYSKDAVRILNRD
ncbi:CDP-alcohol phosphatidyltransferase-domain-containing protein [Zychaea mexicana]|uniref:CDP-alcohol phosphatidyltransferase-domain-containing protein n=1 Tax=Zychaea mexicana TaxID=64656 RepID=UPI0022FE99E0|nr:CDP-alcohol phosphatidyltransferase-domain-containing protein [Zychaea mexicana]KAI9493148.1 CDP-alcohol phosphatidyltransferase-domain-containing protein [Zychaea mexicana]